MCGIAGIWGSVSQARLRGMTDRLAHRGPDAEGFWIRGAPADSASPASGDKQQHERTSTTIGFGHRRLAIIDCAGGVQPLSDRGSTVCFNGAIYNFEELRRQHADSGYPFETRSDTETILSTYAANADDDAGFVRALRGMYAFALWDEARQRLWLARDPVGKKPLYYAHDSNEFLFASELPALLAGMRSTPAIRTSAIDTYLAWGCIPNPDTIYEGVYSLHPGEVMAVECGRIVARTQYTDWLPIDEPDFEPLETPDDILATLKEAVRIRLRADMPVGAFLSGGIDSGLITALASELTGRPIKTITVGFAEQAFDERPLAREVARRYNTDHEEIVLDFDVRRDLPDIAAAYGQPYGDSSAIPSFYVAKAARSHVKVVLNGDGGDELFGGYRRHIAARLYDKLPGSGSALLQAVGGMLCRVLPTPRGYRSRYAFLHRFLRGVSAPTADRLFAWMLDGLTRDELASARRDGNGGNGAIDSWLDVLVHHGLQPARRASTLDSMLAIDRRTVLPYDLLVKMDVACMRAGLEARSPLLDRALIAGMSSWSGRRLLAGRDTKPVLRSIARRYLPEAVCRAPKRGFEIPLVHWLSHELKPMASDVILSRGGILEEHFNRGWLEKLVSQQGEWDPARWSRRMYQLLMLGLWDETRTRSDVNA